MHIEWTKQAAAAGFYEDVGCTIPWERPLILSGVSGDQSFPYYVKNEGTVTIIVSVVNEVVTNGVATWSPSSVLNLAMGNSALLNLTLSFIGDGSYDFDFDVVEA